MNELLNRLAASVLLAVALAGLSYWAGDHNRNNAWLAKVAAQERSARIAFVAETARANAATAQAVAADAALQTSYSTLQGKFNELKSRGPLVVFRTGAVQAAVPGAAVAAAATDRVAGGPEQVAGAAAAGHGTLRDAAAVADAGLGLSLGAVWVWNSALAGTDAPAGACSAADSASAACAADSGIGLADAWQNHITNAQSCATDRLRQQQLIDYLSTTP